MHQQPAYRHPGVLPTGTPAEAVTAWFTLIADLDALLPSGLIAEPEGQGPVHAAHGGVTARIMAYSPATAAEALAILSITHHDHAAGLELSGEQVAAQGCAIALLGGTVSSGEGAAQ